MSKSWRNALKRPFYVTAVVLSTVVGIVIGLAVLVIVRREIDESNEKAAVRQVAAVRSAQEDSAGQNGGVNCLVLPSLCLSDHGPEEPFLEPAEAFTGVKDSYRFVFVSAPAPKLTFPDGTVDFAYLAIPLKSGTQNGFCADAAGIWIYRPWEVERLVQLSARRWSEELTSKQPGGTDLCPLSDSHFAMP